MFDKRRFFALRLPAFSLLPLIGLTSLTFVPTRTEPGRLRAWMGYGRNAQHDATAGVAAQSLTKILWQTPVDLNPPYSGEDLLIHYGSPCITANNTVVIAVKTGLYDGYRIEAHSGPTGSLVWKEDTNYQLPPHNWGPSYGPTLVNVPLGNLFDPRSVYAGFFTTWAAWPDAGGNIVFRSSPDSAYARKRTVAFYGDAAYASSSATYDNAIRICSPLTTGPDGSVYFSYQVVASNPLGLQSGFARVTMNGGGVFVSAQDATGDANTPLPKMNCGPALSRDGKTLYTVAKGYGAGGYLLGLDSITLKPKFKVLLMDPKSGLPAHVDSDGTSAPLVAPDGDVYYGVLENPWYSNHLRGWLLHFNSDLSVAKTPGAFGWDDTPSVVPTRTLANYTGHSSYLLMCKYNNYAGAYGDGKNRIAVLDPSTTELESISGFTTMGEYATQLGPTPDSSFWWVPGAVREWCINSAAVDPITNSIIANCEDGVLYRWNLDAGRFTEHIRLTPGIGEAYTPTAIGANGVVYAINNATLFAVGSDRFFSPR